jgi:hypothetical protein
LRLLETVGNPPTALQSCAEKAQVIIRTNKTGKYGRWLVEIDGVTDELAKIWPYQKVKK